MDERQIESRSSRQWEAIVKLRIRQGESGTTVLRYLVEKGFLQDQARQIVENVIRSACSGSLILVTIGSVAVLLGIVVTVASYLAAASSPFGGTENRLPEFWKEKLNRGRVKGTTSKLLEVVLEEKRREMIKEWIDSGRIEM